MAAVDEVLVEATPARVRAVAVVRGMAADVLTVPRGAGPAVGSIYRARIVRRHAGARGAFAEIGAEAPVFLDARGAPPEEGSAATVQVVEGAQPGKAARVSARLALGGRWIVLQPGGEGVSASRRLGREAGAALAARLRHLRRAGEGLIVRAAAADAPPEAVAAELERLRALGAEIEGKGRDAAPPLCLWDEPPAAAILRAFGADGAARFVFQDEDSARAARALARRLFPDLVERIEANREPGHVFDRHGVGDALAMAERPRVPLPSGGAITIEPTAALTAIDVDTGAAGGRDAALATNLEAAREIARQLRLRESGGLVVVDFLRVPAGARAKVEQALRAALREDRAAPDILGWTAAGLLELVRPRGQGGSG